MLDDQLSPEALVEEGALAGATAPIAELGGRVVEDQADSVEVGNRLRLDIEHLNFGVVSMHTPLGWARGDIRRLFTAQDAGGRCAVSRLVRIEGDELYPAMDLKLFMITTNAGIATTDCLFYAVAGDGSTIVS